MPKTCFYRRRRNTRGRGVGWTTPTYGAYLVCIDVANIGANNAVALGTLGTLLDIMAWRARLAAPVWPTFRCAHLLLPRAAGTVSHLPSSLYLCSCMAATAATPSLLQANVILYLLWYIIWKNPNNYCSRLPGITTSSAQAMVCAHEVFWYTY